MSLFFRATCSFLVTLVAVTTCWAEAFDLSPQVRPDQSQRVAAKIFVTGNLKTKANDKKTKEVPLKVNGYIKYDERIRSIDLSAGAVNSVRFFHDATARIKVDDFTVEPALNRQHALFISQVSKDGIDMFSPLGPVTREELDLVTTQANSLVLPMLLPTRKVEQGETWEHDDHVIAKLLAIDTLNQSEVTSTLKSVSGDEATVEIEGDIAGAVDGIATSIKFTGDYTFRLSAGQVTAVNLVINEDREIGPAEPGFNVEAKVEMTIDQSAATSRLSEAELSGLPLEPNDSTHLLTFESKQGKYALMHDRNWRVMSDNGNLTVLRYIDEGDFISQCNITRLPAKSGQPLALSKFQSDVQNTLGKNFGQFVDAQEYKTDEQLHVLRVVASGESSKLPVQWSYYHIDNGSGERLSLVITLQSKLVERYPEIEDRLVASLQFFGDPAKAETAQKIRSVLQKK